MMRPLILLLLLHALSGHAQDTLLLFHPTAYNLELFNFLDQEGLLDLEGCHVLGVYHQQASYDYRQSHAYLEEGHAGYSLLEIKVELEAEGLFRTNGCSALFAQLFQSSKAAFFMGGPDIPAAIYGEKAHLLTRVTDPHRHYLELSYLFHLLGGSQDPDWEPWLEQKSGYLVSGICLGMQSMHVATGGSMIQDIPTELYGLWDAESVLELPANQQHRNYRDLLSHSCEQLTSYHFHEIDIPRASFLRKKAHFIKRKPPRVLSSHHQALGQVGEAWKVAARSMDGQVIEAIEHQVYPHVFGVQFHPEKPGLFSPDIRHRQSCQDSISFHQGLGGNPSWAFHRSYWLSISALLNESLPK